MAKRDLQKKKISKEENHIDDLEVFIQKKKTQNEALKKIIERINTTKKNSNTDNSTIH